MSIQLIHGDCLEQMKTLPDRSVDLFLCDLPYGCLSRSSIGAAAEKKKCFSGNPTGCDWDVPIALDKFWEQVERLMKDDHTPIIHFCNTKFGYDLIKSKEKWFRYDLVWDKMCGVGFLAANKMPMRSHEMMYVFAKKGAKYYRTDTEGDFPAGGGRRCVKSVIEVANKKGKGKHPTQKPDDIYKWLIDRYSKEGDTILDPTAGSFASCFTAEALGRKAIGIEKDAGFYDKAKTLVKE